MPKKSNSVRTSKEVASNAGKRLKENKMPKDVMSALGSAVVNRKKNAKPK